MTQAGQERNFNGAGVLITGGAAGVGLETARVFGKLGAIVTICGRYPEKLTHAQQALLAENIDVFTFTGDISSSEIAVAAVHAALAHSGQLDVVINNAGTILRKDAGETSDSAWRTLMAINIDGVFFVSRAAVQAMTGEGAIVNVSSTCGSVGAAGLAAYCASKGAVNQLTRAMALELAPRNITVNAVAPGAINSPMLYSNHGSGVEHNDIRSQNEKAIPIGTIAEPAEVARAIKFLVAERHMTGTILPIDGGYTAI